METQADIKKTVLFPQLGRNEDVGRKISKGPAEEAAKAVKKERRHL